MSFSSLTVFALPLWFKWLGTGTGKIGVIIGISYMCFYLASITFGKLGDIKNLSSFF